VIGILVAVRLLVGLGAAEERGAVTDPDITRFHQIATSEGRPYRNFEVYAPVETIAIELLAGGDRRATAARLAGSDARRLGRGPGP
jgi:hypothetical protein